MATAKARNPAGRGEGEVPEKPPSDKGSILVVEDDLPVAQLLKDWLSEEGYWTRQAFTFDETKAALSEEPVDLVTLDIMMPEVNGLEILSWIRQNHPDTGVIMASAVSDLDIVLRALRFGAMDYLLKPFNMDLVTEQVARGMKRLAAGGGGHGFRGR